jgi:hypothetical protein
MVFCHLYSLVMIVSKNSLPKFVNIIGLLIWLYFHRHPQSGLHYLEKQRLTEIICMIGGLLYLIKIDHYESIEYA